MAIGIDFDLGSLGKSDGSRSARKTMRKSHIYEARYLPLKVKAAREAGLHPAFAMGAGAMTGGGAIVGHGGNEGGRVSGSYSSKTISGTEAAAIRESNARTDLLKAQKDEIETSIAASIAARAKQNQGQTVKPIAESAFKNMLLPGNKQIKTTDSAGAQEWEDRYWEFGGAAGALLNIGGDAVANVPPEVVERWIERVQRAKEHNRRMRKAAKTRNKKYKPGYNFSPYKSQRGNWK